MPGPEPPLWDPSDYVLERRFCPLGDIRRSLADYREQVDATEMVVLAFDQRVILQTLCFVDHAGTDLGARLEESLRDKPIRRRAPFEPLPLWRAANNRNVRRILRELADPGPYEAEPHFFKLILDGWESGPFRLVATSTPRPSRVVNTVVLQRGGAVRRRAGEAFADRVLRQVNGTANASVHRDRLVTRQVEAALDELATSSDAPSLEAMLTPLLEMTRNVTQSRGAAVYLTEVAEPVATRHRALQLRRTAVEAAQGLAVPEQLRAEDHAVAAWRSFDLGVPVLLPSSRSAPPKLSHTWTNSRPTDHVEFELAVPVPAGPGATSSSQGSVVICRSGPDAEPFGNYELALLRNVALRVALLRTTVVTNQAAALLSLSARQFAVSDTPERRTERAKMRLLTPARKSTAVVTRGIPADVASALPTIRSILDLAGRMTGAGSVTFRFVTPGATGRYGYVTPVLRRLAAWPSQRLADSHDTVPLDPTTSVSGWVATHGRPCHISDLRGGNAHEDRPSIAIEIEGRRTRSEYCVAVTIDDRVVGTLNFESPLPNAFTLYLDIADACAGQVALAIAAERRKHLREVLSIGSDVQAAAHELVNVIDGAADTLARADGQSVDASVLEEMLTALRDIVGVLRARPAENAVSATTLDEVVRAAAAAAKVHDFRHFDVAHAGPWTSATTRRLYLALYEIFRNVAAHGGVGPLGFPAIYSHLQRLGGREFVVIELVHALKPFESPDPTRLYRVPLARADRLHFGAYLSGAIVRSLGGDVLARVVHDRRANADVRMLITIIYVPKADGAHG